MCVVLQSSCPKGLQGEHRTIVPFWNNYTIFSPQPYTEHHCETRRSSLSPQPIVVPPPSPSSSSVTTPDDASPIFSFQSTEGSSPTPSAIISDIVPANSTLAIPTRTSVTSDGDTSCYEFSMTYSDVKRDEFLSPPADRGFGYRDRHARGRDNRRRRTKVTLTSTPKSHQQREGSGSPTLVAQGATP
ncbi:hypothetical protein BDM02DRAFT_1542754 [Thelephora ganbajun]|uniref:Uncharacterized protein n=1 Tax=Thelephora ganbajun TaxID=370292 RepID=A0ACB6Z2B1_THEGA|nr:hypothetical protein BDM02DRAFT_1542754 [Thelephora ganbajun]